MSVGGPTCDAATHGAGAPMQPVACRPPGTTAVAALAPTSMNTAAAKIAAMAPRALFQPRIGPSLTLPFCIPGTEELTRQKSNRQPQTVRSRAIWTIVRAGRAGQLHRFCTFDVPGRAQNGWLTGILR